MTNIEFELDSQAYTGHRAGPDLLNIGISIFGLGYVGAVSAGCFSQFGYRVIGVDPDVEKRTAMNAGRAHIVEPGLDHLIFNGVEEGRLSATDDIEAAVRETNISLVCVGTPSAPDGSCDLSHLYKVSRQIGKALKDKDAYHVIVYRSTIPPGTTRNKLLQYIEKKSGKTCGKDFGVCFHPEFLRESTAIRDFIEPPKTVIGTFDTKSGDLLTKIYNDLELDVIATSLEEAEMVKYVDNSWHALKVTFANEVGRLCRATGIDSHEVMNVFTADTKLNISTYYLRPGSAFGGSCLPKDVRGINHLAEVLEIKTPVLSSIMNSNHAQIDHTIEMIEKTKAKRIGFLGVTFKANTDDLRESPVLQLMAALHRRGYEVKFYDSNMDMGASMKHHMEHSKYDKSAMEALAEALPLMSCATPEEACAESDTIVVSHDDPHFRRLVRDRSSKQHVVDLVRLFPGTQLVPRIMDAGMNGYLQKPVNRREMLRTVKQWVNKTDSPRVLLAEDDIPTSMATRAYLEKIGCTVETAENGEQAIDAAKGGGYDLIFMDISMPDMTGIDAAAKIRELPGKKGTTPIFALTSYAAPEESGTYAGVCW